MGPKGPKEKMNGRLRNYEAELKRRREEKLIVSLRLKNHHPSFELPFHIEKMNERLRNYETGLKRRREEKLSEFEIEESSSKF
ncbi:hypothetical protein P8452_63301 [Trifolium repens]|nr:hypothetical protein P8452_63301 [Trifolium repens]